MWSWRYVAALLAVLGAFGLVQVHVVEVSIRGWWLVAALVLLACLAAIAAYVARGQKVNLPATVANLRGNRLRTDRSFEIRKKRCEALILDGNGTRRDVRFRWTLRVRNRRRARLGAIDLVLLGEVPASERDLVVYVRADGDQEKFRVPVDRKDRLAPSISIPLPAPGLARGEEADCSFEYQWPSVAHVQEDSWVFDVNRIAHGGKMEVELVYPRSAPQVAEARVVRRRWGLDRSAKLGRLNARSDATVGRLTVEFEYVVQPHDDLLLVNTWSPIEGGATAHETVG